jgi:F-type H+-transporting ATPase subunit a
MAGKDSVNEQWWQISTSPFEIKADTLFYLWGFPITNTVTTAMITTLVVILFCLSLRKTSATQPGRYQLAVETVTLFFADFLAKIVGDVKQSKVIVPITASLALLLLAHNLLLVLLPFLGAFEYEKNGYGYHLFRILPSDLNAALGLSVAMFIIAQIYAVQHIGLGSHISKYLNIPTVISGFKQGLGKGFESIIFFFVGILELISTGAKVLSLSLRLFGNIFAGEVLLVVALNAMGFALPSLVLLFGVLVGAIQALVFSSLTAANLKEAGTEHH